ncbi:MAG TPA: hypothetical protein PKX78_02350 [Candidatus Woesebacteria bacterium]|nr:hypothetical protein [Candidatus Woesebacteria bacterium]
MGVEKDSEHQKLNMGERRRVAKRYVIGWLFFSDLPNGNNGHDTITARLRQLYSEVETNGRITQPNYRKFEVEGRTIPVGPNEVGKNNKRKILAAYSEIELGKAIDQKSRASLKQLDLTIGEKTRLTAMLTAKVLVNNDSIYRIDDIIRIYETVYSCVVLEYDTPLPI